jgi:hypothetical protein
MTQTHSNEFDETAKRCISSLRNVGYPKAAEEILLFADTGELS